MRAESADGYALAFDPSSGWICYAKRGDDGGLHSSGIHYLGTTDADTRQRLAAHGIAPGERASSAKVASIVASTRQSLQRTTSGPSTAQSSLDVRAEARYTARLGSGKGLVVLVDFSDRVGTIPISEYEKAFNGDTYDALGSIRTWIESISYDKYSASHTVIGYMRASYPTSHYLGGAEFDYSASAELMKQVYAYIDAEIDLTDHATNGVLPSLVVIYPGAEIAKAWATGLWPHAGEAGYTTSERVRIANIFISNAGSKTPMDLDTYRHELGHSLFGWPDTYDYDDDSAGAGGYATETTLPCAPFRVWSGWMNVIDVVGVNQSYSLVANGDTCLRYKNANNASEFFIVEYMRKEAVKRPDAPDEGLLIWHVDEKGDNSLQDMTPTKHYELSVEQADGLFELEKNSRKRANDLFHAGNKDRFDDNTTPDSHWWNDTASGFKVCNIGGLDPSMTLTVGCSDGIADAGIGGASASGGSSGAGGTTGSGGVRRHRRNPRCWSRQRVPRRGCRLAQCRRRRWRHRYRSERRCRRIRRRSRWRRWKRRWERRRERRRERIGRDWRCFVVGRSQRWRGRGRDRHRWHDAGERRKLLAKFRRGRRDGRQRGELGAVRVQLRRWSSRNEPAARSDTRDADRRRIAPCRRQAVEAANRANAEPARQTARGSNQLTGRRQPSHVGSCRIPDGDQTAAVMAFVERTQGLVERFVSGLPSRGDIRIRTHAPAQSAPVQVLPVLEPSPLVAALTVELGHLRFGHRALVANLRVLGTPCQQERLEPDEKRRGVHQALVPQQRQEAPRLENSPQLAPGSVELEPVERLRRQHHVDAAVRERGGLRGAVHAHEAGRVCKRALGRRAHLGIGLDREHACAPFEQRARGDSRTRPEIACHRVRAHPRGRLDPLPRLHRIGRTIRRIVVHQGREALPRIHAKSLARISHQLSTSVDVVRAGRRVRSLPVQSLPTLLAAHRPAHTDAHAFARPHRFASAAARARSRWRTNAPPGDSSAGPHTG
jgi:M6 family metalloprotease-like protein